VPSAYRAQPCSQSVTEATKRAAGLCLVSHRCTIECTCTFEPLDPKWRRPRHDARHPLVRSGRIQIKIFTADSTGKVEGEVNVWLGQQKLPLSILASETRMHVFSAPGGNKVTLVTITVWYS
jgi:hypothetical protein